MKKRTLTIVLLMLMSTIYASQSADDSLLKNKTKNSFITMSSNSFDKTSLFSKIPNAKVIVVNRKIKVSGANLQAVYNITGQEVRNVDLKDGIYIIKISKGTKVTAVKVVIKS